MQPTSSYFICFTQRSGSNLLCESLADTGVAGRPREYFNNWDAAASETPWVEDWKNRPFGEALARVFLYGTTPNGVFASKIMSYNLHHLDQTLRQSAREFNNPADRLASAFPNPRYIWVTRRDKVRQAVSLVRAKQSEAWVQRPGEKANGGELRFNFQLIDSAVRQILREEADWANFFSAAGIEPLTVVYEDLALDRVQWTIRVLNHLGIPLPMNFEFQSPSIRKQADDLSEDWVRRYCESERSKHRWRTITNMPAVLRSRPLRSAYVLNRVDEGLASAPESLRRLIRSALG